VWLHELGATDLAPWLQHAELSVAPLSDCERNSRQGCAPLKLLESMAAGVPVVASDLASVTAIAADGEHGLLVPPDRPAELARAIRTLLADPAAAAAMGARGRRKVTRELTWRHSARRLDLVYGSLA
jgi:glycosyltransferase involved in cell wall biosynthesis